MDCIFCMIKDGKLPSAKVYENEFVYAFKDISPNAPVHIVVIPKEHIASVDEINENNASLASEVVKAIPIIAKSVGLINGYRVITNVGEDGRQSVKHMHFHILGGTKLAEKLN